MQVDVGRVDVQGHMVNARRGREANLGLGLSAFHENLGIAGRGALGIVGRKVGWGNVGDEIGDMQFASIVGDGLLGLTGKVAAKGRTWDGSVGEGDGVVFGESIALQAGQLGEGSTAQAGQLREGSATQASQLRGGNATHVGFTSRKTC